MNNKAKEVIIFNNENKVLYLEAKKSVKEDDFSMEHIRLATNNDYFCKTLCNEYKKSRITCSTKLDSKIIKDTIKYGGIAKYINYSCNLNGQITA